MEIIKVFVIATTGGVFLQAMDPLPGWQSGESTGTFALRIGISIIGGVISTLVYRLLSEKPGRRILFKAKRSKNHLK